jgi:hypothetical protein
MLEFIAIMSAVNVLLVALVLLKIGAGEENDK